MEHSLTGQVLIPTRGFVSVDVGPMPPIQTLIQDKQGFLWFGSDGGLQRYDGKTVKTYTYSPSDSLSISSSVVYYLFQENERYLWVGTGHGGTNRLDLYTDKANRFLHNPDDSTTIDSDFLYKMFQGNSGSLWFLTDRGLNRLIREIDENSGKFQEYFIRERNLRPLRWSQMTSRFFRSLHQKDLFCGDSMYLFHPEEEQLYHFIPPTRRDGNPFQPVTAFIKGDNLWMGSRDGVIASLDVITKKIQWYFPGINNPLPKNLTLHQLFVDDYHRLWLLTEARGVFSYHLQTNDLIQYTDDFSASPSLKGKKASHFLVDRSNILWVGTDKGLNKLPLTPTGIRHVRPIPDVSPESPHNRVSTLMVDRAGTLWISANRKLHRYYPEEERYEYDIQAEFIKQGFPPETLVKTMFQDSRGDIWFGTMFQEVYRYTPGTKRLKRIELPGGPKKLIRSIIEASDGALWFGIDFPDGAMVRYDPHSGDTRSYRHDPTNDHSLASNSVWQILEDGKGRFWVAMWGSGLDLFDPESQTFYHFKPRNGDASSLSSSYVTSVVELPDGNIWLGTWNGGINKLIEPDEVTETRGSLFNNKYRFQRYTNLEGFSGDNQVVAMQSDDNGNLWMSTGLGISRFSTAEERFSHYTAEDGVQGSQFAAGSYTRDSFGNLFFGGVNGYNVFHPDSLTGNPYPPGVVITSFKIFEKEVALDTLITHKKHLIIPFNSNFISFEFRAMDFTDPTQNQYEYKLLGFHDEWISSGNRQFVSFSHLDPGNYTFLVRAANNDGIWSEHPARLYLTILPPWWKTRWAYVLYLFFGGALLWGGRWVMVNWNSLVSIRAKKISHFKLLERIGSGGMGEVFKAVDVNNRRVVALKCLNEELLKAPDNHKRFSNEGRLLASFSHPNIVKVYEIGETEKQGFIAMEYLSGGTLKAFLEKKHPVSILQIKNILLQIATGLQEIHRRGVIHRDIKTGNIMFDEEGSIRIMDFGLSKSHLVTTMTTLGTVLGTLGYVAPEQITGSSVDQRVDIFSFGVMMYEMCTGVMPFTGENEMALIHKIFNHHPPSPSSLRNDLPSCWDEVINRCLEKNPESRFHSMGEVMEAIIQLEVDPSEKVTDF